MQPVVLSPTSVGSAQLEPQLAAKLARLREIMAGLGQAVVAYSGGADSALVAYLAHEQLGDNAVCVTAVSPSLASSELGHCRDLAETIGIEFVAIDTNELNDERYIANGTDRCYWCKTELMSVIAPVANQRQATVVLGVNVDDLAEHRPGQEAAREAGARFPLVEAGLTKADVRAISHHLGLSTWDRPGAACLASRIPYGTPVSLKLLTRIDRGEMLLKSLGFSDLRLRDYDETARIEVGVDEISNVLTHREKIVDGIKALGYRYVTLDLEGFRSGNLN